MLNVSKIRIVTATDVEGDTYIVRDSELTGSDEEIEALKEQLGLVKIKDTTD